MSKKRKPKQKSEPKPLTPTEELQEAVRSRIRNRPLTDETNLFGQLKRTRKFRKISSVEYATALDSMKDVRTDTTKIYPRPQTATFLTLVEEKKRKK